LKTRHLLFVPMALGLLFSCGKKDPDELSSSRWIKRNITCAEESIETLIKKLEVKAKEAESLSVKLQLALSSKGCPNGSHLECTPELGIQAIATYLSTVPAPATVQTPPDTAAPAAGKPGGEKLGTGDKNRLRDIYPEMPKEPTEKPLTSAKMDTRDLGLSPDELASKSRCGVKVTATCAFTTLDSVISQLTIFTKQAQVLETEASRLLALSAADPYRATVQGLYLGMRNLEANIQEMVTLEEAVKRRAQEYKARYDAKRPLKIKGIIVDLSKVVPTVVSSRLKSYIPKLKTVLVDFRKRHPDYREKLGAALRDLKRAKRQYGNTCLDSKGCWKFRACVKRYRLPGITLYRD